MATAGKTPKSAKTTKSAAKKGTKKVAKKASAKSGASRTKRATTKK
jgi:hypothetical protein